MTIINGYTTLAAIKAHKDIASTDATDDGIIDDLINAASRYIDAATGNRRFYSTSVDETRTYQAANAHRVYTDDILTVTTLKTDDDGDRTYETTWATTDYDLLPENAATDGRPYTYIQIAPDGNYSFPTQRKGVQIVGKFGYSSTTPPAIEIACRLMVLRLYQNRFGVSSEGPVNVTAAGVVITPQDIPASVAQILKQYTVLS